MAPNSNTHERALDAFVWHRRVGFGDCDPARIAFTGSIVTFVLEALDAFWDDVLDGEGWYAMAVDHACGMPFVRLEFDFAQPVTPRAALALHVRPERLGTKSVTLAVRGVQGERTVFCARLVSVFTAQGVGEAIEIPSLIRRKLVERFETHG